MKLPNLDINRFTYRSSLRYSRPEEIKVDFSLVSKLNDFTKNYSNPISRSLKYNQSPTNQNPEDYIFPVLNSNQGSFLRNINDYKLEESGGNIDDKRLFKYLVNSKPEYNILNHHKITQDPVEIKMDKWSKFHEK